MNRSKYEWRIDGGYIFITDLNQGGKSVTNDIENVLDDITKEMNTTMDNYIIFYQDTDYNVDGVKTKNGKFDSFILIGATNFWEAKCKFNK